MIATIYLGDCLVTLRRLPDGVARTCVTSPPYFGLRDYGVDGQIGLESTPDAYVARLVEVFREVRRVLADDGTLWLNLGDSYAVGGGRQVVQTKNASHGLAGMRHPTVGAKPKDLLGIPWRVAFALQADGWYLRSDIIWAKPNPMPESVRDRPTKAHEYVFLLSKSAQYYYAAAAIAEPATYAGEELGIMRAANDRAYAMGREPSGNERAAKLRREDRKRGTFNGKTEAMADDGRNAFRAIRATRNARTVWTIATQPYPEAHFATFPEELPSRCIRAGSAPGDTVLDPFGGSGTTGSIAVGLGRGAILCELNPAYVEMAVRRIGPMLCEVVVP